MLYFNQNGAISFINEEPLKLTDQVIYIGNIISSTERDVKFAFIRHGLLLTEVHVV